MEPVDFLKVLFDDGQHSCFGNTTSSYKVSSVFSSPQPTEFVCLNALNASVDNEPSKPWHAPTLPRRADCNVICFRNFLIECDTLPIDTQLQLMADIKLPYSTAVYSGGKSVHFIVSLQQPLDDIDHYRWLAKQLMDMISQKMPIDVSTKNPSRLTRLGGSWRKDKEQKILELKPRVKNSDLQAWALKSGLLDFQPPPEPKQKAYYGEPIDEPIYSIELLNYITNGAPNGQRNNKAFWVCCELMRKHKALISPDKLISYLVNFSLPQNEKRAIVESARSKLKNVFKKEI